MVPKRDTSNPWRIYLACALVLACGESFVVQKSSFRQAKETLCSSTFDDEYLPPNPDASPDNGRGLSSTLSSSYPEGTPSCLRGEAVRSALLSGRCIGWDLTSDPDLSVGGVLQVQGEGMQNFLNNKLTQEFSEDSGSYQEACLLDAKGRVVDRLKVSIVDQQTALILTSPSHGSNELLERLDPFIFPMDQIKLKNWENSFAFSLASKQWEDVERSIRQQALSKFIPGNDVSTKNYPFPARSDQCMLWGWDSDDDSETKTQVLVIPSVGMPSQVCVGFTFVFFGDDQARTTGQRVWEHLVSMNNDDGAVEIGALEYETLRVEAGVAQYGSEIGKETKVNPIELHWLQETINIDKGCYLGQEGIASMAKNPRGPPRTLYSVVFEDEFNFYESQSRGDQSDFENLTKPPQAGEKLFALGSNEELSVGTLTSIGEPGGTGEPNTVALAMVRRADSILKQMEKMDLEIPRDLEDIIDVNEASGMIEPPPLDPLDGLEVIVEGTFTIGKLRMLPNRRLRKGKNIFDPEVEVDDYFKDDEPGDFETSEDESNTASSIDESDIALMQAEAEKAAAEAEAAAAEAKRKADKMEMLKKRAEEAMARRKQKKAK